MQFKKDIFIQDSYQEYPDNDFNLEEVSDIYSQNEEESQIDSQNVYPTTNFNFQENNSTNGNSKKKKQKLSSKCTTIISTTHTMQKTDLTNFDEITNYDEEQDLDLDKKQKKRKRQKRNNTKQNQRVQKVNDNGQTFQKVRKQKQKENEMSQSIKKANKEKKKYKQNCHEKPLKNMKSYFKRLLPKRIDYPRNRKQHILDCMSYLKSFKVLDDILSSKQLINVSTPIELLPKFYADNKIELEKIDR